MYSASVNGRKLDITNEAEDLIIDGNPLRWDIVKISADNYHILYDNKSYRVEIVKVDTSAKTFTMKINGRGFTVELKDKFDLLLEKMGMNALATNKLNLIKAPMPGLIIELKVKVGDSVNQGDQLLILEAMKMENILKSPGSGIVKSVRIKKGESVEKGQLLIEF